MLKNVVNRYIPSIFHFSSIDKEKQENAQLLIKKNMFDSNTDYGMQTREEHKDLLKFVLTSTNISSDLRDSYSKKEVVKYIEKHQLFNDVELASLIAKTNPSILILHIEKLRIQKEFDRYELIELIGNSSNPSYLPFLITHFDKFDVTTLYILDAFIDFFIEKNKVNILLQEFNKLRIPSNKKLYILKYLIHNCPNEITKNFKQIQLNDPIYIKEWIQSLSLLSIPSKDLFDYCNLELGEKTQDPYKIANSILVDLIKNINFSQFKELITMFITKNEKYRNKDLQNFISIYFLSNVCSNKSLQYLNTYKNLTTNTKGTINQHLLLPMVIIASWVHLDSDKAIANELEKLLSSRKFKLSLKSSTGFMQILLKNFSIMTQNIDLPDSKKLYHIYQAICFSKCDEKKCKKSLNISYSVLSYEGLFEKIINELSENYVFEDFELVFNKTAEKMLSLETQIDNFAEKYAKFEEKMRIPNTCLMYVTNLQKLKDFSITKDIQKLVHSLLDNQVDEERYFNQDNLHMNFIRKEFPFTFEKWKVNLEPRKIEVYSKKPLIAVDTDEAQDLFLCGTEINGSCQRIDGSADYNKGLMAYVLDGKNRLLAIKESDSGRIQARCLLRLLLDDKTREPVLFQERIYPPGSKYANELTELAKNKAKYLNVILYSCNEQHTTTDSIQKIISLGNSLAYEYVDGMEGMASDGEIEIFAYKL